MASNKPALGDPAFFEEAAYLVQTYIQQERYAEAEGMARAMKEKLPNAVKQDRTNTLELHILSLLDQSLWGQRKPQWELDAVKAEILDLWQTKYRPMWEAQGRPKKLSSWARGWGNATNYKVVVNEYYIPESIGDDAMHITAYYKVIARPKVDSASSGTQQLPRIFKVETSTIALELGSPKPYILREYFMNGGGGSTRYTFSKADLNCKNVMQAAVAFLNSNETHSATMIPGQAASSSCQSQT